MPDALPFTPLTLEDTASLADRVYLRLRDAIVAGALAPHSRVSERQLAASLGVSAAPVRDALRRLETEGMVVTQPRRGTLVADFGPVQIEQMGRIRVALEAVAAGFAARRVTPAEIAALRAQLVAMRDATRSGDAEAVAEANGQFHAMLHAVADNAFLTQTLRGLRGYESVGRRRILTTDSEMRRALREHAALLAALRRGDSALAEARMRAHGLRSLQQAFAGPAEPAAPPHRRNA
ncbi:GntR family transcriptional regulator [Roseomonas sp. OT10]|uniref:GntR family transcriptional regulator n=1 Tax=Roseomonas cutis TaxID=2897332 RepID=UPI001E365BD1|nr:GntR family transcriptional regulator [Roseomonas sp. OT10]UFN49467.1 GntR family transcriptional regulator [Roseomonas sp. OT10]